ncbi:MAG: rubrerythrin [bacterium]
MSFSFNANEVFEMAKRIERNGARFYRQAAGMMSDPSVKQRLLKLASMEDGHELIFENIEKELLPGETEETVFDPDAEAAAYLKALADHRVFIREPEALLKGKNTLREILQEALKLEKESVLFYTGMKLLVPENLGKKEIELLIIEEMSHIAMLGKELGELKQQ